MTGQALPALATSGGQFLGPFLFEALAQFGLAAPLPAVALVPLTQLAVEGAVVPPVASGQEVGDAHVYPDHRGRGRSLDADHLVVTESQPPERPALVERHAGIEGLVFECLAVVGGQFDGN